MTEDERAERRAFLAEHFPALRTLTSAAAGAPFVGVFEDGAPVDVTIEGQPIYGGDARRITAEQVQAYKAQPLRLHMNEITDAGLLSQICIKLATALDGQLRADGQHSISKYPIGNPTFLIVFGLGLGYHLEALARHSEARWLVLVEPNIAFFEHALATVDWPALAEGLEARGGNLHIITESDPTGIANAIVRFMGAQGIAYADGSWIFTHYPFWAFAEARQRLHQTIEFVFVNRGFFEDELRMLGNATANFRACDFRLLEGKPRLERPETAVIVGAGPSLDETMETLRRIRDRVLLFSCGTALRPLLKHGFIPDFHCELENVPELHGVIEETARFGDLSQVTLIASATVDPRVPPFFGSAIFLFRDLVSSTEILGRRFRVVPGVSPTGVNLGLAAAAVLGCTDFVFFGTDCGTRPGGKRHADGTIYGDIGVWQERDSRKRNTIELEGNFGGTITTDWVYDACRIMLANTIETRHLNVRNCSDGALIPGARPCAPEALEIAKPPIDRGALKRALQTQLPRFAPGELLKDCDVSNLGGEAERMFDDLFVLLDEVASEPDFAALYDRLRLFASGAGDQYGGCLSIITGTLTALPRIAMFYGVRLGEGPLRHAIYGRAIAEIRGIVAEMREATRALLREVAAGPALMPAA